MFVNPNNVAAVITGKFPDIALFEGFRVPVGMPQDITAHATHDADMLQILTDHYGQHGVVNTEECKVELKIFNIVVASIVELKRMSVYKLMSHLVKSEADVSKFS